MVESFQTTNNHLNLELHKTFEEFRIACHHPEFYIDISCFWLTSVYIYNCVHPIPAWRGVTGGAVSCPPLEALFWCDHELGLMYGDVFWRCRGVAAAGCRYWEGSDCKTNRCAADSELSDGQTSSDLPRGRARKPRWRCNLSLNIGQRLRPAPAPWIETNIRQRRAERLHLCCI